MEVSLLVMLDVTDDFEAYLKRLKTRLSTEAKPEIALRISMTLGLDNSSLRSYERRGSTKMPSRSNFSAREPLRARGDLRRRR